MPNSTVTLVGNLTRDPDLKYTPAGRAVVSLGVAVNSGYRDRSTNEWIDRADFIDVSAWGDLANNVAASLTKGAQVIVVGRMQYRSWEQDGKTRSKVDVVAEHIGASVRFATVAISKISRDGAPAISDDDAPANVPAAPSVTPTGEEPF